MKRRTKLIAATGAVVLVWISAAAVDYVRVDGFGEKPLFTVSDTSGSEFTGLGYSYTIYTHPLTQMQKYALSIFGIQIKSTFTNAVF